MHKLVLFALLAAVGFGVAGCVGTSDPFDPAIQAMGSVNSCGQGGSDDVNQCHSHPRN